MARVFNGSSDRIDVANESVFDFDRTNPFSISVWLNTSTAAAASVMVGKWTSGANGPGYEFRVATVSGRKIEMRMTGTSQSCYVRSTSNIADATWTHLLWTNTGSSTAAGQTLYINGSSDTLSTVQDTLATSILNNQVVQLGCRGGTGTPELFLNGQLAGFGIWNVALIQQEATDLAAGSDPLGVRRQSLLAALPLCGSSPEPDVTLAGNDGTLTGTTTANGPNAFVGCNQAPNFAQAARIRYSG